MLRRHLRQARCVDRRTCDPALGRAFVLGSPAGSPQRPSPFLPLLAAEFVDAVSQVGDLVEQLAVADLKRPCPAHLEIGRRQQHSLAQLARRVRGAVKLVLEHIDDLSERWVVVIPVGRGAGQAEVAHRRLGRR